ncbi:MAG: ferritin-like domain-containing protein [Pseudonocardia sp.]
MFEGFSKSFISNAISRSSENSVDRRRFMQAAGLGVAGVAGVAGVGVLGATTATTAFASGDNSDINDAQILNFALNLEYLEAEFYLRAIGKSLDADEIDGTDTPGGVTGGSKVPFETKLVRQYAEEIAADERAHVNFLRAALGAAKVSRPKIDLKDAFTAAATAAGVIKKGETFDPFKDENSFLLGAYIFEDVGVTAYKGASPLVKNKTFLEAAAGILAVEAYHAGLIRTVLLARELEGPANKISDARDSLDGDTDLDQGITKDGKANVVPADKNAVAFSRSPGQVLNIVYLNPGSVEKGGFFPDGVNGELNRSA